MKELGQHLTTYYVDVVCLRADNPSVMTGLGTNTWLVANGDHWIVVDPGPYDLQHVDRIIDYCAGKIDTVVVTHTHLDHSPAVALLVDRLRGVDVYGRPSPVTAVDGVEHFDQSFVPTHAVEQGTSITLMGGRRLEAIPTPGHASNHVCWLLRDQSEPRMLFSGDHIIEGSTVVIPPPDGDMSAYLHSLAEIGALAPREIAPGHGRLITDSARVIDEYIKHRLRRESSIASLVAAAGPQGMSVDEIADREYVGLDVALRAAAKHSVWAHLRRLEQLGRVALVGSESTIDSLVWRSVIGDLVS